MKTNLLFGRFWSGNRRVNHCRLANTLPCLMTV
jgi:hypothetical protein